MDQYEQAVLDYLCGVRERFVNAQFTLPKEGLVDGKCPDFVVLDFKDTTAYVVEVTSASNTNKLIGRVRARETLWFTPLRKHLAKLNGGAFAGWDYHVTLFVRNEQIEKVKQAIDEFPDVSVISLKAVVFSWKWYWQGEPNLPTNALREPAKQRLPDLLALRT
jgi:hypothetical protein